MERLEFGIEVDLSGPSSGSGWSAGSESVFKVNRNLMLGCPRGFADHSDPEFGPLEFIPGQSWEGLCPHQCLASEFSGWVHNRFRGIFLQEGNICGWRGPKFLRLFGGHVDFASLCFIMVPVEHAVGCLACQDLLGMLRIISAILPLQSTVCRGFTTQFRRCA